VLSVLTVMSRSISGNPTRAVANEMNVTSGVTIRARPLLAERLSVFKWFETDG